MTPTADLLNAATPGPWRYYSGSHSIAGVSRTGVSSAAVCVVCGPRSWRGESSRDQEREANARLIAAAPDLLAVLKALLEGRPELWGDEVVNGITDFPIDEAALFAADSAIAKAEGR